VFSLAQLRCSPAPTCGEVGRILGRWRSHASRLRERLCPAATAVLAAKVEGELGRRHALLCVPSWRLLLCLPRCCELFRSGAVALFGAPLP